MATTTRSKQERERARRQREADARKPLAVPEFESVVRVSDGLLAVGWREVERAEAYDVQVRRSPNGPLANERAVEDQTYTEFTRYPLGPPGVPQVRMRAVSEKSISPWSEWQFSDHDIGRGD